MTKYFINLTNGIEAVPTLVQDGKDYSFIRIQSTACEQHRYSQILLDLDYDFLMNVALGNECIVYDYSMKKQVPRAMYQGLEFIKFVLWKYWFHVDYAAVIYKSSKSKKFINVTNYFENEYKKLDKKVFKKLRYFLPYKTGKGINIECITNLTSHDGDKDYYADILKNPSPKIEAVDIRFAC